MTRRLVLVGGGVRSGKSRFALARARELGGHRVLLATAQALDEEMRMRIAAHARERGPGFVTVEEPLRLVETLARLTAPEVVVIDCLTLWLSNLLVSGVSAQHVLAQVRALRELLARRLFHAVVVTNEVGLGVVPESPLGRAFRDVSGAAHQELARIADEIYLGALGVMLRLHPAPVALVPGESHGPSR